MFLIKTTVQFALAIILVYLLTKSFKNEAQAHGFNRG